MNEDSVSSCRDSRRTRPILLLCTTWALILFSFVLTHAHNWITFKTGQSFFVVIQAGMTLYYTTLLGLGSWIDYRFGAVSRWTYLSAGLTLLAAIGLNLFLSLWNMGYFLGSNLLQEDVLFSAVLHNGWGPTKLCIVAIMMSSLLHRAFGLVLAPQRLVQHAPNLGTRFMMLCVVLVAVILAIDARTTIFDNTAGMSGKAASIFNSLAYFISPCISAMGVFGVAWLMVADRGRKWIGGVFIVFWGLNLVGMLVFMTMIVLPAMQKEIDDANNSAPATITNSDGSVTTTSTTGTSTTSIQGPELWSSIVYELLQLLAYIGTVVMLRLFGYRFQVASRKKVETEMSPELS